MLAHALDPEATAHLYWRTWTGASESASLSADDLRTLVMLLEDCYPRQQRPWPIRQLIATLDHPTEYIEWPDEHGDQPSKPDQVFVTPDDWPATRRVILEEPPIGQTLLEWLTGLPPRDRGLQLRCRRKDQGLTLDQVARLVGVTSRRLSKRELGRVGFTTTQVERYLAALEECYQAAVEARPYAHVGGSEA